MVLGEWKTRGRSRSWKILLSLHPGEQQTVAISRGNLHGSIMPGSLVLVQFWHGKVTSIQYGDREAETCYNPDWLLDDVRCGTVMLTLLLLGIVGLLLFRIRFRARLGIRVSDC